MKTEESQGHYSNETFEPIPEKFENKALKAYESNLKKLKNNKSYSQSVLANKNVGNSVSIPVIDTYRLPRIK